MDRKIKYCEKCGKKTEHILRGFGTPGSFVGNARWECLECDLIKQDIERDEEDK